MNLPDEMPSHYGKQDYHKCFTTRLMDALFFSDAVYEQTPSAALDNLTKKLGIIHPLLDFGFEDDGYHQAVLIARSRTHNSCDRGHIVVACRGTSGVKDLLQDLKYFPRRVPFAQGAAHCGFMERAQTIPIDSICEMLASGEDVTFTGHSLGGAVASLLSLRVLESTRGLFEKQVQCITFGAPLFANWHLAEFINDKYKDLFIHIISENDFVPRVVPFFSIVQKLLYASENHLQGLWILKKAVECLNWLHLGVLIKKLEQSIPSPAMFILKCLAKLSLFTEATGSFAFAGHLLMLESREGAKYTLSLACADDLNMWYSLLNFGFGVRLTASMMENHAMSSYYEGIVLALSEKLKICDDSSTNHKGVLYEELYCSSDARSADTEKSTHDSRAVSSLCASERSSCRHPENDCFWLSTSVGDFEVEFQRGGNIHIDAVSTKKGRSDGKRQAFMKHLGCCANVVRLFLPFTWENLSAGAPLREMQISSTFLGRSFGKGLYKPHVLRRFNSWSHSESESPIASKTEGLRENKVSPSSTSSSVCEIQTVLTKNVMRTSHKKNFRISWLIGSIGRVVRHLYALDNLCILTVVGIFVSNLHV